VLATLNGVIVSAAALVRGSQRLTQPAGPSYDALINAARTGAVQHVDETAWEVVGRSWSRT
jgi:hypothetical protein